MNGATDRRQFHARGVAADGDGALAHGHRNDVGENCTADGVDSGGPALLGERLDRPAQLRPVDDLRRAKPLEVVRLADPAGDRVDDEAEPRQQRDGDRADTAGRAGHHHRTAIGPDAVTLQRHHGEHRRIAGGADRHRLRAGHAGRQRNQPIALDPRHPAIGTVMHLTHAPAVEDHLVARLESGMAGGGHRAGQIDARDHREAPHHRQFAGDGKPVLVVDGRIVDGNVDIAVHQVGRRQLRHGDRLRLRRLVTGDEESLEAIHAFRRGCVERRVGKAKRAHRSKHTTVSVGTALPRPACAGQALPTL